MRNFIMPDNENGVQDEYGVIYSEDGKILIDGSKATGSYTVKEGTEIIGTCAFKKNWNLQSVSLPLSIRTIEFEAFSVCERLKEINLPEGLIKIGINAFYKCINLTSLRFPDSLKDFHGSFDFCPFLNEIIISPNRELPYSWRMGRGTPYPKVRYDGETDKEMEKRYEDLRLKYKEEEEKPFNPKEYSNEQLAILLPYMGNNDIINLMFRLDEHQLFLILKELNDNGWNNLIQGTHPKIIAKLISRILKKCQIIEEAQDDIDDNDNDPDWKLYDLLDEINNKIEEDTQLLESKDTDYLTTDKEFEDKETKSPQEEFYDFFGYYPVKEMPGWGPDFPAYDKEGNLILKFK